MKTLFLFTVICGLVLATGITNARAAVIHYTGEIYAVSDNSADSSIIVGTTFSGTFRFDDTLPDMSAADWYGNYYPNNPILNSISVRVGNSSFLKEVNRIVVYDDKKSCGVNPCHFLDRFFINAGDNLSSTRDFIQIWFDETSIGVPTPTVISSDSLPAVPLNLDLTSVDVFTMNTSGLVVSGWINSLTMAKVSETSTLALLSISLACLYRSRRKTRHQNSISTLTSAKYL